MGHLLLYQDVYDEAMKAFRRAYHYCSLLGDQIGMIKNLCTIGETYTGYGRADSAMCYFQKAYKKAVMLNHEELVGKTNLYISELYNQLEQFDKENGMPP